MMRNVAPDQKLSYDDPPKLPFGNDVLKKKRSKATQSKKGFAWKTLGNLGGRKERKPVKFGGEMSSDSDLSDDEDSEGQGKDHGDGTKTFTTPKTASPVAENKQLASIPTNSKRPPLRSNSNSNTGSSTPTLVDRPLGRKGTVLDPIIKNNEENARLDSLHTLDYDKEIMLLRRQRGVLAADDEDLDYSDYEERAQNQITRVSGEMGERAASGGGWSPAFLAKHASQNSKQDHGHTQIPSVPVPGPVPVPATPSLLKALDRVAVAQRAAYGIPTSPLGQPQGQNPSLSSEAGKGDQKRHSNSTAVKFSETDEGVEAGRGNLKPTPPKRMSEDNAQRAPRWEEFWREVRVKAQT